jgi:hypothetical protein
MVHVPHLRGVGHRPDWFRQDELAQESEEVALALLPSSRGNEDDEPPEARIRGHEIVNRVPRQPILETGLGDQSTGCPGRAAESDLVPALRQFIGVGRDRVSKPRSFIGSVVKRNLVIVTSSRSGRTNR